MGNGTILVTNNTEIPYLYAPMARKNKNKDNSGGFVYSTDPDFSFESGTGGEEDTLAPAQQDLRIHLQRFKGNKIATVIKGFVGDDRDLKDLGKMLKSKCGTGGSVKDGEIIIQGEKRSQVGEILRKEGYRFKNAGG